MIRVVLDTNVFISGIIMDYGVNYEILESWENGEFEIVLPQPIIQEIQRVLYYPHIKNRRHLTEKRIELILNALRTYAVITPSQMQISVIKEDPDDNMFIIAAIEGDAEYIISGDRHLLEIGCFGEVKIISPSEFYQIFKAKDNNKD